VPRSITSFTTGPGFAQYALGLREEFTIQGVTALATAPFGPDDDDQLYFDCLNPNGDAIYRQSLGTVHQPPVFYSLSPLAEPMEAQYGPSASTWPQADGVSGPAIVTMGLTPVTLIGGCVARVYAALGDVQPDVDPFSSLDPTYVFTPHLWVEDVGGKRVLPPNSPPLLTHIAA
jgi:hypothetical protein